MIEKNWITRSVLLIASAKQLNVFKSLSVSEVVWVEILVVEQADARQCVIAASTALDSEVIQWASSTISVH